MRDYLARIDQLLDKQAEKLTTKLEEKILGKENVLEPKNKKRDNSLENPLRLFTKYTNKNSLAIILLDDIQYWDDTYTRNEMPNWDYVCGHTFDEIMDSLLNEYSYNNAPQNIIVSWHAVVDSNPPYFGKKMNKLTYEDFLNPTTKEKAKYVDYFYKLGEIMNPNTKIVFGVCSIALNEKLCLELLQIFCGKDRSLPLKKNIMLYAPADLTAPNERTIENVPMLEIRKSKGEEPTLQDQYTKVNYLTLIIDRPLTRSIEFRYGWRIFKLNKVLGAFTDENNPFIIVKQTEGKKLNILLSKDGHIIEK
jgi:hypothetical protein